MKLRTSILAPISVVLLATTLPAAEKEVKLPMAKKVSHKLEIHGTVRTDPYYWLNDRDNPEVIKYLEKENAYTDAEMSHTREFQNALFKEIKGRIKQTDESVPYHQDGYWYYRRMEDSKQYPIFCRKQGKLAAPEQVMLDVNELAEGHDFFSVGNLRVSFGRDILAFAVDSVGRRIHTIQFKNLSTGEILKDEIPDVTGNMAWANDNRTLFYAKQDPTTLRSFRILRHLLGTDSSTDELVYEEQDDTFSTSVSKTRSQKFLMITSSHTVSTECRYLDAGNPAGEFKVVLARQRKHEYGVDHLADRFYMRTNDQATNFRLMSCPIDQTGREHWEEIIGHREDVLLEGFVLFDDYLVVRERAEGLVQLRIRPWSGEEHYLDFGEPAYLAYSSNNPETNTKILRYGYTSLTTPNSTYDYNMVTREKKLLKRTEVLGGFDSANYTTERIHATARDGTKVPVSIVYRREDFKKGTNPLLLYGYGSYGISTNATFRSERLSLVDRGFVFAIAHIRGGQEMGRRWYEDGKLLKKQNTFTDFIDVAEHLAQENYCDRSRMYAVGGSAGGLLMGTVINMRPDLFDGVVAAVPFVDVVTTMLDDSIPLTTSEYDEWGNPNEKPFFDYMLSYSPYDNVEAKEYPHLLVTAGLHDSQVQYWEPAKWVAKLRAIKKGGRRLLLQTEMSAGHGGPSGRYERYRKTALEYAFMLDLAGSR